MKKLTIMAFAFLLMLVASQVSSAPRMTMPESVFNFGYVPQNSKISHDFWLHSTGDDSLKIIKVIPGWGCTKAPLSKKELAVGDSTLLEIIFSTKSYKNRITKRPKIQTNEGPPDKRVQIIANVVARPDSTYPLVMKPYKLDLSQFGDKLRDKIDFTITNVSDENVDISMIAFAEQYFDVNIPKSIEAGKSAKCSLKLKKDAIKKNFEKSFTIETTDAKNSRFTMPVKRKLRASTQASAKTGK